MKCPFCAHEDDKVLESRSVRMGEAMKRRRECLKCQRRFTTYEQVEELAVMVVKRDGRRERFDRGKILKGMTVACEKRPVAMDVLESITDDIERSVYDAAEREIESSRIGEMVAEALRNVDQVAYVRFASVYWQFEDIKQFREIVEQLGNRRGRRTPRKQT